MRKWLVTLSLVLALVAVVSAQSSPKIQWTHDGLNLSRFEAVLDGGAPINLGIPTPVGNVYEYPLMALTAGTHTLVIRACYDNGTPADTADDICASSAPITIVKL